VIGTWLVVAFFVVLGIGVVLLAMNGTKKAPPARPDASQRARLRARDRAQTRTLAVGITAVVLATGIAIPAVIMVANASGAPERGPGGVELTAHEAQGRELFAARCSQCHDLAGANAVGRVGPDLDEMRPPKALVLDAIEKGRARGLGQMPRDLYEGEEADAVAAFVERVAGR
jgi:mono/diheme cytochrome c family protein